MEKQRKLRAGCPGRVAYPSPSCPRLHRRSLTSSTSVDMFPTPFLTGSTPRLTSWSTGNAPAARTAANALYLYMIQLYLLCISIAYVTRSATCSFSIILVHDTLDLSITSKLPLQVFESSTYPLAQMRRAQLVS